MMSTESQTVQAFARDELAWARIAATYDVEPGPINLEHGYFGRMTRRTVEVYQQQIDFINRSNSVHVRQHFDQVGSLQVRDRLAQWLQVPVTSLALTRCASESMQSLIRNYNGLEPGDQLLVSDLDYISVQAGMRWLARARGLELIEIQHAHPASHEALVEHYRQVFERHPRLKLMVLTHVTHRTGLVMPVKAIAGLARQYGVDVLLDGAHALGQLDFRLDELGVAFAGYNLQKWLGAPLSLGFVYIEPQRLGSIDPDMGDERYGLQDIRSRAPYGTPNIPAWLTLPTAIEEHLAMGGAAAKGARLRYLRDCWVGPASRLPGIEILTPEDPRLNCGITSFRFKGAVDHELMVQRLLKEYNLFTTLRDGSACGPCIRVTPGFTTTPQDMQHLVDALSALSAGS